MLDKFIDQHKNPVNLILHLVGFLILVYSLWNHSWIGILTAIILAVTGHLYVWAGSKKLPRPKEVEKEEMVSSPS